MFSQNILRSPDDKFGLILQFTPLPELLGRLFVRSIQILGVALTLSDLEQVPGLRDFTFDRQRDVEIQDFNQVKAPRGDHCKDIAEHVSKTLHGHTGPIGIQGPLLASSSSTPDPRVRAIAKSCLDAGIEACPALDGTPACKLA
jgi:hypothetical protein